MIKGKGGALRRDEVSQGLERAHWFFCDEVHFVDLGERGFGDFWGQKQIEVGCGVREGKSKDIHRGQLSQRDWCEG